MAGRATGADYIDVDSYEEPPRRDGTTGEVGP